MRIFVALLIIALLGTGALYAHIFWPTKGWHFVEGLAISGAIVVIGLYGALDLVRAVRNSAGSPSTTPPRLKAEACKSLG